MSGHRVQIRTRVVSVAVVVAVTLVAASCSSSGKLKSGSGSKTPTSGGIDTSHPFRIASPWDGTGASAAVGKEWRTALEVATDKINANGGILGREVVVDYQDTQSDPVKAGQITSDMSASGKYQAVIATSAGATSPAIDQAVIRAKILGVFPTLNPDLDQASKAPTLFDNVYTASYAGAATACIGAHFNPKRVAILAIQGTYPDAMIKSVKAKMSQIGAQVVETERYAFTATDITAQVQKIIGAKPDVVFLFAYFASVATALQAFQNLGATNLQIVGDDETMTAAPSIYLPSTTKIPPGMIGENWAFNSLVNGTLTPSQKDVISAIGAKIGGKFSAVVGTYAYDYDALYEVKWAAEAAKSDATDKMVAQLNSLSTKPNVNTGAPIISNPGYSADFHAARGGQYYADDFTGFSADGATVAAKFNAMDGCS